ncbi:integrin alpha-L isoform X1 [Pelodiscus sinensis]|uniref:integrin alpha-L isoform X1 n=1 Tax=Pelodiscus sinensis TaxID=13735 RepID=UPI003F6CA3B5
MARTPRALPLLLLLGLPLPEPTPTLGYNIDTIHPRVLASDAGGNFGYQVLQSKDASLLVGAPGDQNSTGQLYQCAVKNGSCQPIPLPNSAQMPYLGMVLESDSEDDRVITCGPGLQRTCDGNLYVSGACYLFRGRLERPQEVTPGYVDCLKGNVDLVFLFDGSGSMTDEQFQAILDFMISVMEKLGNSTIRFAAVQFSLDVRIEFDFNAYKENPNPRMLLGKVRHMKSLTFTFKAIHTVAEQVFTPKRGAREDAKRVMIMITDGDPSDSGDVKAAEKKNIVRYIIGIGNNFAKDKFGILKQFASEPVSQFVKVLDSFDKLKNLFSELQAKIYDIEGTSSRSSFHLELSSSGFSVDMSKGRLVLGAVGADDWAGGLIELQGDPAQEIFIKSPSSNEEIKDAYLGYAVKSMQHQNRTLYAVGAPRYQHIGMVVVFQTHPDSTNWTDIQHIKGKQIGSYFGAVLCSVDMDGDGDTDMLLVGSPLYYEERSGGRVHIYHWDQARLTNTTVLQGAMGNPLGRFGAAITQLADLNGDGWADVAVGAPLENEERGAVYIYNGHPTGLNTEYSQRIEGATVSPGVKYFGQSIHGQMDLGGDGLTDIAVGALGEVFVLSSRPILTVTPTMHFLPKEIPVKQVECSGAAASQQGVQVTLTVCFDTVRATVRYREPLSANLTYWLEVDANRMRSRGEFGNGQRNMSGSRSISDGEHCINERLQIGNCIEDYVTPINILLRFALEEDNITSWLPVLNPLYNSAVTEIPFEKNCGKDEKCEADLKIHFHENTSKALLVSPSDALQVVLKLINEGEDAYRATVHMPLPPGLSFRKASVLERNVQARISCNGLVAPDTNFRNLSCNISHPIYWGNSSILFQLLFDVLSDSSWEDFLELQVMASSDNERNGSLENNRALLQIPVLYPVNIITKRLDSSTQYVNFSSLLPENKTIQHLYQVENLLPGSFPQLDVTVFVVVPDVFLKELFWLPQGVQTDSNVTCHVRKDAHSPCFNHAQSCLSAQQQIYECRLGELDTPSVITVTGLLHDASEIQESSQSPFCTALCFTFNTHKYSLLSNDFMQSQVTTEVELVYVMNYLPIYVGSGVGGLLLFILIIVGLYKCGFFKRNYKERLDYGNGVGPAGASPEAEPKADGEQKEALTTDAPSE